MAGLRFNRQIRGGCLLGEVVQNAPPDSPYLPQVQVEHRAGARAWASADGDRRQARARDPAGGNGQALAAPRPSSPAAQASRLSRPLAPPCVEQCGWRGAGQVGRTTDTVHLRSPCRGSPGRWRSSQAGQGPAGGLRVDDNMAMSPGRRFAVSKVVVSARSARRPGTGARRLVRAVGPGGPVGQRSHIEINEVVKN